MFLEQYQIDALFKNASGSPWVGQVHCLECYRECVPFIASDRKYIVQFITPYFFQGSEFYKDMLFPMKNGDYFIPKSAHRLTDISVVNESSGNLSMLDPLSETELRSFAEGLCRSYIQFVEEYLHINQFFSRFVNDKMADFCNQIIVKNFSDYTDKFSIEVFENLAPPNYGFQIHQK